MKKIAFFLFGFFLITSCKQDKIKYFYFYFSEKTIKDIDVQGDVVNGLENGEWSIFNSDNNKLLSKGRFVNGLKEGLWLYRLSNNKIDSIDWYIYKDTEKDMILNLPKGWKAMSYPNIFFSAVFETKSKIPQTKYFVILKREKDSSISSLHAYFKKSMASIIDGYKTLSHEHYLINDNGKYSYFSFYSVLKENEPIFVLDYVTEYNNEIFGIAYSSLDENEEYKKYLFTEIIKSIYIGNKRLFDPFKMVNVKYLEE